MRISRKKENEFLALAVGEMLEGSPQHKVALEQQRIELTQTKDALERLLNRYLSLYEFAPVGYFTLNQIATLIKLLKLFFLRLYLKLVLEVIVMQVIRR